MNGIWNFALFACVDKVAVRQRGGSATDGKALHGGKQWAYQN